MKKLFSLLCLAACVFCMTACASKDILYDADSYKAVIQDDLQAFSDASDMEIMSILSMYGASIPEVQYNLFTKWMQIRPEVGEYVGVLEWNFVPTKDDITVKAKVDYTLRDVVYEVCYLNDSSMDSAKFTVQYTFAEQFQKGLEALPKAGLNTVIGMGVVFVVLILISLLIGCFKFINKFEQSMKNKKESKAAVEVEAVDNTIAQIVQKEQESVELVDDLELVAVIAAAIAAHTGTSTDGFVVRSIRKSNKNKWRNA